MHALTLAVALLAASPSPAPPIMSSQLLAGEWRSEQGGTFHFRPNGRYSWHAADEIDEGRWILRDGHTLELLSKYAHGETKPDIIVIDRIVHETLYVRTKYQSEVWLKQPGP